MNVVGCVFRTEYFVKWYGSSNDGPWPTLFVVTGQNDSSYDIRYLDYPFPNSTWTDRTLDNFIKEASLCPLRTAIYRMRVNCEV